MRLNKPILCLSSSLVLWSGRKFQCSKGETRTQTKSDSDLSLDFKGFYFVHNREKNTCPHFFPCCAQNKSANNKSSHYK